MKTVYEVIIVIAGALLVLSVVMQQKGSGLSGVFGGSDVSYMSKRGAEKFLVYFTIFCAVVLGLCSVLILFS